MPETAPQTPARLRFALAPEASRLLRARERIRDYLTLHCADPEAIDDVVLAIEEAATNVIRHSGSNQEFEIFVGFAGDDLQAVVKDRGSGFDVAGFDRMRTPDPMAVGGRGLFLMAHLMDDLALHIDGGLEVSMTKRALPRCQPVALESGLEISVSPHRLHHEARLRTMLEEIEEAFAAFDWEYRCVHLNEAALRLSGRSREELLGQRPWDLWPAFADTPAGPAMRAAMELGKPSVVEFWPASLATWLEVRVYPTPTGISAYFREINDRKRVEQELLASHAELAATLAAITDGFYTLDRTWRVTYLNDQAARVFPDGKHALGASFFELFPGAAGSDFETNKRRAMEHGEFRAYESYYPPFDAWFEERDYPSKDGITVLFTDISERKRLEEELRRQEEQARHLIRYAPAAIYEVDFQGPRFVSVNDFMCELSGYSREELLAMSPFDLLDEQGQALFRERIRKSLAGERTERDVEYRFLTKQGEERWSVLNVSPTVEDGKVVGAFVVAHDVTERKRAEEERQRLLVESQAQAEELQAQGEELQAQTEELQAQTEELRVATDDLSTRATLAEALNAINRRVHSTLESDQILQAALDDALSALSLDAGAIEMREESCWVVRHQLGFSAQDVGLCLSEQDAPNATRTMLSREPLAIADMEPDPTTNVGFVRAHGLRSVLSVPLIVRESMIGCLLLYGRRVRHFTEAEIDFGRKLGAMVSLAIANARLFSAEAEAKSDTQRQLESTSLLLEAATAAISWTELRQLLESIGDLLLRSTDHSRVVLELWDEERQEVEIAVSRGSAAIPRQRFGFDGISDAAKEAITTRKTVIIDYAETGLPERLREYLDEHAFRLLLAMPIVYRERLVGLIMIDQPGERRPFSPREIELIEAIAAQAGAAIENARLLAGEAEAARLATALSEIAASITRLLDHDEVMRQAVAQVGSALGAESATICDLEGESWVPRYLWQVPEEVLGVPIPRDQVAYANIGVDTRRAVAIDDCETDPRVDLELQRSWNVRSVMMAPLLVRNEAKAAIFFNYHSATHTFTSLELDFAQKAAALISGAMENARLYEAERMNTRINEALARVDQSIHSTLDRDQMLRGVALESATAIGADSTVLALREGEVWVVRYAYNYPQELIGQGFVVEQAPFIGIAVETQRPVAIDDAFHDPRAELETQQTLGVRAVMMTPLIVRDEPIGGLFFNYRDTHHFTPEEVLYASRLGTSLGLALANIALYEAQRTIATTLQENFVHALPTIEGLELAAISLPAAATSSSAATSMTSLCSRTGWFSPSSATSWARASRQPVLPRRCEAPYARGVHLAPTRSSSCATSTTCCSMKESIINW